MRHLRPAAALLIWCCGVVIGDAAARVAPLEIGAATADGILSWEVERFVGETRYTLDRDASRPAIRAESDGTASALLREIDVDLSRRPVLEWSWKVGNLLQGVDETTKAGDDYPARVYVLFRTGLFDPRPNSISYVWSSTRPAGTHWPNAFTGRVRMVAVRDAGDPVGTWVEERRNVREDIRKFFGEEVNSVKAVAIMTDTDNSGQQATAWYGDIRFVAE
ncbi:MAG: DUF3047 domain-containing protein [Gammaproteobacteria bacterium]|nr:DUF3047 domain-containing protein [Gammaproteobacteria bacterium]